MEVRQGGVLSAYVFYIYYASPSSGEAYRDRQLTTNFKL